MADTMTCPLCGQEHPASTTYCPHHWAEIPAATPEHAETEPAVQEQRTAACPLGDHEHPVTETYCDESFSTLPVNWATPATAPPPAQSMGGVTCADCGFDGTPGTECLQCGMELPQPSAAQTASLLLPSGDAVPIPRGRDVVIGRQSDIDGIRHGLEPFDAVSRRHCYVSISSAGDDLTVRDPGSANHTWVGDNPEHVEPDEIRSASLPVRLRLGQHVSVTISAGGAGA